MNVYDEAHNLAKAIKESNEYLEYAEISKEAEKDEQLSQMIKEIREISLRMQAAQISGEQPDAELTGRLQSVYAMLAAKPLAMKYLEAETRMQLMMKDVFEILGDAMGGAFNL